MCCLLTDPSLVTRHALWPVASSLAEERRSFPLQHSDLYLETSTNSKGILDSHICCADFQTIELAPGVFDRSPRYRSRRAASPQEDMLT